MKAVIETGGKQYIVAKDDVIDVELISGDAKTVTFTPLMVIDDKKSTIGTPLVDKASVKASIVEADKQSDKVTVVKFKAKKRVHSKRGHRQRYTTIKITSITA